MCTYMQVYRRQSQTIRLPCQLQLHRICRCMLARCCTRVMAMYFWFHYFFLYIFFGIFVVAIFLVLAFFNASNEESHKKYTNNNNNHMEVCSAGINEIWKRCRLRRRALTELRNWLQHMPLRMRKSFGFNLYTYVCTCMCSHII